MSLSIAGMHKNNSKFCMEGTDQKTSSSSSSSFFFPILLSHSLPFLCLILLLLPPLSFSFGRHTTFYVPNDLSKVVARDKKKGREKSVEVQNKFGLKRRVEIKEMTSKVVHSLSWASPALKSVVNQVLALCKAYGLGA